MTYPANNAAQYNVMDDVMIRCNVILHGMVNRKYISAVDESRKLLLSVGFKEIKESDSWDVKPLDKVNDISAITFTKTY